MKQTILDLFINKFFSNLIKESEIITANNLNFYIEILYRNNEIDFNFIKKYKKDIKAFFDKGYESAGLGSFLSCFNDRSVQKNTKILKIARQKETNIILAMTIYNNQGSDIDDSKKCVGATILKTNNNELKQLAKESLEFIIRQDIKCSTDYYWCECSGVIKHWFEKHGGIKLPNAYLPMFMSENQMNNIKYIKNENFDYIKIMGSNTEYPLELKKCVFGFPNKEVLEKYINDKNLKLDEFLNTLNNLNETIIIEYNELEKHISIINYFYNNFDIENVNIFELTKKEITTLSTSINYLEIFLNNSKKLLNKKQKDEINLTHDCGIDILIYCSILKPYKLGYDFMEDNNEKLLNKIINMNNVDFVEDFII